ncbi:MAG: helix-turn-helix transcriptional regulator [Clostridia bacterium]|nr:helix-turn-helix transcriptional regulator [Clostridia bacterium]
MLKIDYGINVELIKQYIKENKLSVKEFCKQCKVSVSTYYKIINGKNFDLIYLYRIAKRLHLSIHEIFKA